MALIREGLENAIHWAGRSAFSLGGLLGRGDRGAFEEGKGAGNGGTATGFSESPPLEIVSGFGFLIPGDEGLLRRGGEAKRRIIGNFNALKAETADTPPPTLKLDRLLRRSERRCSPT